MSEKDIILQELKLRRLIKKAIRIREAKLEKQKRDKLGEEEKLRKVIRHLLKEDKNDTDPAPHGKTSVNFIGDILDILLPVIKQNLRQLTTKGEQRVSFRDNILRGISDIFAAIRATGFDIQDAPETKEKLAEGDELNEADVTIDIVDDPDVVVPDSEKDELDKEPEKSKEEEKEEEAEAEFEQFRVEGSNVVGARSAYQALKSSAVESEIKEKVKMFGEDDPDGEIDDLEAYLLYNANVWFNIYEKKLAAQMGQQPAWDVATTVAIKPEGAVVKPEAGEAAGGEGEGEEEEGGDDFLDAALEPDAGAAEEVDAEKEGLDDELGL